jgi:hypothetical protein
MCPPGPSVSFDPPSAPTLTRLQLAAIGLTSAALLVTELALTRIFSVTMYYHFAFLAISIALLGLSASGVYTYVARPWLDRFSTQRLLAAHGMVFALVTLVSLTAVIRFHVGLRYTAGHIAVMMLLLYALAALPFFAGGCVVALAITRGTRQVNAVYAADLVGASGGCLLLLPLLNVVGAPGAVVVAAAFGAVAAVFLAPPELRRASVGVLAVVVVGPLALSASGHSLVALTSTKGHVGDTVLFERWNSFSRVAVYDRGHHDWSLSPHYSGPLPASRYMDIDSAASTPILKVGTDLSDASYLAYDLTALAFYLKGERPGETETGLPRTPFTTLVIGPGGGRDLLSALIFGASHVDAVEINPIIVNEVMLGRFRAYSGGIYANPRVALHIEDGRSYVRRVDSRYDVIQASLVDTWAATSAGAYTLTENMLYTAEAFDDYLDHLTDNGLLTITRWRFDGLRLVSLAQEACERRGWNAAERLALVQHENVVNLMLKRSPFTPQETGRLARVAEQLGFRIAYLPGRAPAEGSAALAELDANGVGDYVRLVMAPDRRAFYRAYPIDITPTTDDRPFFFNTTRFGRQTYVAWVRSRLFGWTEPWHRPLPAGFATGGLTALLVVIGLSALLVALFVIGPLSLVGRAALAPGWLRWLGYFGCLGTAYMMVEIALLQRFVLLLGHPVYSLTVTLFSLLLGTGVGSWLCRRIGEPRLRMRLVTALAGIVATGVVAVLLVPPVVNHAVGWPIAARLALSAALLLPAGVLMGIPLPSGMRLLAGPQAALVPWAWGINGALSVLGSGLAVLVAMTFGFSATILAGASLYALAAVLVLRG